MNRCLTERFPTRTAADAALLERRTRALLAGSPRDDLTAYTCTRCHGAHLGRTEHQQAAA